MINETETETERKRRKKKKTLHGTRIPTQAPDALRLHARHPQQIVQVGSVRGELGELCVEMGELSGL